MHAKPGAARPRVGGMHGDGLMVAVQARAVDGAANAAVIAAVAEALGVRPRQVSIVRGDRHRDKLLRVEVDDASAPEVQARLERLRVEGTSPSGESPSG